MCKRTKPEMVELYKKLEEEGRISVTDTFEETRRIQIAMHGRYGKGGVKTQRDFVNENTINIALLDV